MPFDFVPPQGLVDAVRNRTLVPFVGAGVSVGAVFGLSADEQFPDWEALILRLADRLEKEKGKPDAQAVRDALPDTMAAAQIAVDRLGRDSFLREMKLVFDRARPPGADLSAVDAIWRLRPPFVITTNYDRVLEWPWKSDAVDRIVNFESTPLRWLEDVSYPKPRVWHLHGSIDKVDTLILTQDQYLTLYPAGDNRRTAYQNAFNYLQHLLTTRPFLFIGFSLTEPVLRKKIQEVLDLTGDATQTSFLLIKKGNATEAQKTSFFKDYHVQVIEFDDFGEPMVRAIDAIGQAAFPDALTTNGWGLRPDLAPLVDDLLEKVSGLVLGPRFIRRAHRLSRPRAWPDLKGADSITLLREAIPDLARAVSQTGGGLPPLLNFVNRVKNRAREPYLSDVAEWLDDALSRFGVDPALLEAALEVDAKARAQVLVRIQTNADAPNRVPPGQWLVHVWSWSGKQSEPLFGPKGRLYKEGSSGDLISDLTTELEEDDANAELTSIAFIVPASLAWQPIHNWRLSVGAFKDPPIGATYTVTVRPLERLQVPLARLRVKKVWNEFQKNTKKMFAVLDSAKPVPAGGVIALMLDASTVVDDELRATLARPETPCVVLRAAPSAGAMNQLADLLRQTEAPVVVWSLDANQGAAEQMIRDLLQSGTIESIPERIRKARNDAFRDKTGQHRGADVMLIWDNADYVPPEQERDARAGVDLT